MRNILVGHSSFYLRTGWIKKGVEYVKENTTENIFSKSNIDAIDILGIGSVMVQSLRFWMELLDILEKNKKQYILKRNIEQIIKKDPYLQNKNILWLLHTYIIERENQEENPIVWNLFFKNNRISVFTEESGINLLKIFLKENGIVVSERSIKDSILVFIKNYYKEKNITIDPEDNMFSPFTNLEYLMKNDEGEFYFRNINSNEISEYIVLYLLLKKLSKNEREEINLNEAYHHFNSIIKIRVSEYQKLINMLENRGILSQDRAAGLQNIHVIKKLKEEEIIERL